MSFHLTQDDTGQMAVQAIKNGDFTYFKQPVLLILGKTLVGGQITGDVFDAISPAPIAFYPAPGFRPIHEADLSIELGGPWSFYERFWTAHGLEQLPKLLPEHGIEVSAGELIQLPLLLHNNSGSAVVFQLEVIMPDGWTNLVGPGSYEVPAHQTVPVYFRAKVSATLSKEQHPVKSEQVLTQRALVPSTCV